MALEDALAHAIAGQPAVLRQFLHQQLKRLIADRHARGETVRPEDLDALVVEIGARLSAGYPTPSLKKISQRDDEVGTRLRTGGKMSGVLPVQEAPSDRASCSSSSCRPENTLTRTLGGPADAHSLRAADATLDGRRCRPITGSGYGQVGRIPRVVGAMSVSPRPWSASPRPWCVSPAPGQCPGPWSVSVSARGTTVRAARQRAEECERVRQRAPRVRVSVFSGRQELTEHDALSEGAS